MSNLADKIEAEYDPDWLREYGLDRAFTELRRLSEENTEQSRLLGMSAERELRLRAINAQLLEAVNEAYRQLMNLQPIIANGLLTDEQLEFIDPHIDMALMVLSKAPEQA